MSYVWRDCAYNSLTRERMYRPQRPSLYSHGHYTEWLPAYYTYLSELKVWEAFIEDLPTDVKWKRSRFTHATEKGVPVPHTGKRRWHSGKNGSGGSGVIGNSRVLPHRYMDDGDKGAAHNRHIKRLERVQWLSEWQSEQREQEDAIDAETVAQWFYDNSTDFDFDPDLIPSVYTVGETVVEWPSDYYGEYDYEALPEFNMPYDYAGPYSIDDYVDFDPYDFDGYADFCGHCGGPCEL